MGRFLSTQGADDRRYGTFPHSSVTMDGCTVHNYNDGDVIACFDENIPDSVIKTIANKQGGCPPIFGLKHYRKNPLKETEQDAILNHMDITKEWTKKDKKGQDVESI